MSACIRQRAAVIAKITRLQAAAERLADLRMSSISVGENSPLWAEDVRTVREFLRVHPFGMLTGLTHDEKIMAVLFCIEWLKTEGDLGA